jgi:hypothetical protein
MVALSGFLAQPQNFVMNWPPTLSQTCHVSRNRVVADGGGRGAALQNRLRLAD